MTTSISYLLASLLVATAAGQLISDRSRLYYDNLESSSQAPQSDPSELQQAEGEELIVYLTSEQANVLKAAGAVVQPLPDLENQFRQINEQQSGAQLRPTEEDSREDREQDNYYTALNAEQQERESEENSSVENQSAEEGLENSARNNKGTSQARQREFSTLNTLNKLNKDRTQENGNLKSKLNRNQPRIGYTLEDIRSNTEYRGAPLLKEPRQSVEIKNVDEFRQVVNDIKRYLSSNAEEALEQADEPEDNVSNDNDNNSETIQDRPKNPPKVWESEPLRESSKIRKYKDAEEKIKVAIANSRTIQRQFSSLSAPKVQQQRKSQRIVEQNEQLVKNEPETTTETQQTEDDDNTYATDIKNLKDIVKRIELAQKLSLEKAARETQSKKSELDYQNRRPAEIENQDDSRPVLVKINKPLKWRWPARTENIRPIPVPVLLNENNKVGKQSSIKIQRPNQVVKQYYVNTGRPYLQKESDYKPEIPSSLAIIQRIWDN